MMPPPNVTGQLHMGHALNNTLQDCIIRYKRMKGFEALWMPGTDHASIATEVKVVEKMKDEEGLAKADVGREGFLTRAWAWKEKYGGRIIEQLKRLGCSCDWDRLAFTMDERRNKGVIDVFVRLYRDGYLYKGDRIVNWCVDCKTAISDAEVEYETEESSLWHIKYPLKEGGAYITVATTRPETMLGDTAVAVNPDDKRYQKYVGKTIILPLLGREIPIVADAYVDKAFGTGAVKVTPAHDPNDFEIGARHSLPVLRVMNDDGTMNANAGSYAGLTREACRAAVVKDLERQGHLVKIQKHSHNVGHCYRCNTVVEPVVSRQWFVRMRELAGPAIRVVTEKEIKITPKRFEKIYLNWMYNIRDWCVSRQLWWGHRIPAYTCTCGDLIVDYTQPDKCPRCGGSGFKQDEDVLDTWFSSALWPFSTLGFPDKTPELKYFYPTDVLVTAYEIIFFWVARMIFSGLYNMGEIPFKRVAITGLVRDNIGRKMSKSLGNGIDPLELIDKYGADSLRFSLLNGTAAGGDMRYSPDRTESARNFMNKIWNAARFFHAFAGEGFVPLSVSGAKLSPADKWILTKLNAAVKRAERFMDNYDAGLACAVIYDFIWGELCDWYIELLKPAMNSGRGEEKRGALSVLLHVLKSAIKLLHPVAPFITEEIWKSLPRQNGTDIIEPESIMVSDYPAFDKKLNFTRGAAKFDKVRELIRGVRNLRAELNVPQNKRPRLFIFVKAEEKLLRACLPYIKALTYSGGAEFCKNAGGPVGKTSVFVSELADAFLMTDELVDFDKERARILKEIENAEQEIARAAGKLSNENFMSKAPKTVADAECEKLTRHSARKAELLKTLERLK